MRGRKPGAGAQTVRVFALLRELLANREGLGSRELAKRLGVTQRQANRDIDVLIAAGVEVLTDGERYSVRKTQTLRALGA